MVSEKVETKTTAPSEAAAEPPAPDEAWFRNQSDIRCK